MARQALLCPRPHNVIRPQQEGDKDNRPSQLHKGTVLFLDMWSSWARPGHEA